MVDAGAQCSGQPCHRGPRRQHRRDSLPGQRRRAGPELCRRARTYRWPAGARQADVPPAGAQAQGAGPVPQGHREQLYDLAFSTGATKIDNMVDIDGGIGVLFTFASKGRRELPNAQILGDGPTEILSKDGSFIGEHVHTRIPGVAVQINAFNFPVWGMLEKLAPAFIAGVPSIVKPATPTGYLTAAVVKLIIESNILPAGSLQLISGSARTLLDELDYRDLVSFTGSASTARLLKSHVNVVDGGIG